MNEVTPAKATYGLKKPREQVREGGELSMKRLRTERALSVLLLPGAQCHPALSQGSSQETQQVLLLWHLRQPGLCLLSAPGCQSVAQWQMPGGTTQIPSCQECCQKTPSAVSPLWGLKKTA